MWTMDKIKNCKEIVFGTLFNFDSSVTMRVVLENSHNVFASSSATWLPVCRKWNDYSMRDAHFYRPDGTVIEPTVNKVKVDLYEVVRLKNGLVNILLYDRDRDYYYGTDCKRMYKSNVNKYDYLTLNRIIKTVEVPPYL